MEKKTQRWSQGILLFLSVCFVMTLALCLYVYQKGNIKISVNGFCVSGLSIGIDRFRSLYGMLCTAIWLVAMIVAGDQMKNMKHATRFYMGTLVTYLATLGIFYSNNLLQVYILFEVMSLCSYLWVAHREDEESKKASFVYLMVSVISGLVMLMGAIILYSRLGNLEFGIMQETVKDMLLQGTLSKTKLYVGAGCMLFGFGAKAGAFPMQFYLHSAYPATPAPAAAILSAALTKAGIFGILILTLQLFQNDSGWAEFLIILGVITMLVNALIGIFQMDVMRILACSSVSQLGFIILGCGLVGFANVNPDALASFEILKEEMLELSLRGTVLYMVNHSVFKLILFLAMGILIELQPEKSRDLKELQGLGREHKLFLLPVLTGCAGLAGIPLFSGYIAKTLLHEGIVVADELMAGGVFFKLTEILFLFAGGCTFAYVTKIFVFLFVKKPACFAGGKEAANTGDKKAVWPIYIPTVFSLICGLLPTKTMDALASVKSFGEEGFHISYFSLENLKGSAISILIGLVLYFGVVRPFLSEGNRMPKWLNMEKYIISPLFGKVLPAIAGAFAYVLDQFVPWIQKPLVVCMGYIAVGMDALVPFLQKVGVSILTFAAKCFSNVSDFMVILLEGSIFRSSKNTKAKKNEKLLVALEEASKTTRIIGASLSFGFLMLCLGLCVTLLYLLLG